MFLDMPNQSILPSIGGSSMDKKAILFVFSPKNVCDHTKRPLMYNFGHGVKESIIEKIYYEDRNPGRGVVRRLLNDKSIQTSLLPAAQGINMGLSIFSNSWTGVLIVFNDFFNLDQQSNRSPFSNDLNNRIIYIGLFNQEPINPLTVNNASPTVNPEAQFYITRKIIINKTVMLSPTRGTIQRDDIMADIGVFHNDPSIPVEWDHPSDRFYNLEPDVTLGNTRFDEGGQMIIDNADGIASNAISKRDNTAMLETHMQSPKKNLDTIFSTILHGIDTLAYEDGENIHGYNSDGVFGGSADALRENVSLDIAANTKEFVNRMGLDSNQAYTMKTIMATYGGIMVQPIIIPKTTQMDIIPQKDVTPNNVFSSLLSACIPSYMVRSGLSMVSFMYNSFRGALNVLHLEAFDNLNGDELMKKWNDFFIIFKVELEQIIIESIGHFDLVINSSVNGSTHIHLNALDFKAIPENSVYEQNNLFGGIGYSSIGNYHAMGHNAKMLNSLISSIGLKRDVMVSSFKDSGGYVNAGSEINNERYIDVGM